MKDLTSLAWVALLASSLLACGGAVEDPPAGAAGSGGSDAGSGGSGGGKAGGGGMSGSSTGGSGGASAGNGGAGQGGASGGAGGASGGAAGGGPGGGAGAGPGGQAGAGGSPQGGSAGAGAVAGSAGAGAAGSAGFAGGGGGPDPGTCSTADECAGFKTPPGGPGQPPAKAGGGQPDGAATVHHTVSRWFVGDTDRQGNSSADAWKKYGFDIDGWNSTPKQGFHCQPVKGATLATILTDADGGIDNSFGKNIVNDLFLPLVADPSGEASLSIQQGGASLTFDMGKLGSQSDYASLPSQVFPVVGQQKNGSTVPPGGDWSSYGWSPLSSSLNPDGSSTLQLGGSYMVARTWVSSPEISLSVALNMGGFNLALDIHRARISLLLKDPAGGTEGNIGGLLDTEELAAAFTKLAGNLSSDFCNGSAALDGILEQLRLASDILTDGTQDPSKTCNGISIGLGFNTKLSSLGAPITLPPPVDPCK